MADDKVQDKDKEPKKDNTFPNNAALAAASLAAIAVPIIRKVVGGFGPMK